MAEHRVYHWKHGWIPLTHEAALQKAHGSEKGAAKYLGRGHASTPVKPKTDTFKPVAQDHLRRSNHVLAGYNESNDRFALVDQKTGGKAGISSDEAYAMHQQGKTITGVTVDGQLRYRRVKAETAAKQTHPRLSEADQARVVNNVSTKLPATKPAVAPGGEPDFLRRAPRLDNPNHMKAFTGANPGYDPHKVETYINCAKVTIMYELRRKGYDVQASHGSAHQSVPNLIQMWRRKDGAHPTRLRAQTRDDLELQMSRAPVGARYIVYGAWQSGTASHVWNAEKTPNGVRYFDAQVGNVKTDSYFKRVKTPPGLSAWRVDDAMPVQEPVDGKTVGGFMRD